MNDSSQKLVPTLDTLDLIPAGDLLKISWEELDKLENEADRMVFKAGSKLEWIRNIKARKRALAESENQKSKQ